MMVRVCLLFLLLPLLYTSAFGQSESEKNRASVRVVGRSFGDSIVLRFAPTSPIAWNIGNKNGYKVERYILFKGGKMLKTPEKTILTPQPLLPLPLSKWETLAKQNKFGAIAAQALYGKTFQITPQSNDIMSMVTASKELENRFSFALFAADQSLQVADASALKYTDKSVKKGEKYVYRVSTLSTKDYPIDTGFFFVGTDEIVALPKPVGLKAEFGDKMVTLSWNNVYYQDIYKGYWVERSDDKGITFKKTHELPFVNTMPNSSKVSENIYKVDTFPANGVKYIYRVRGATIYDEIGPPSDTISGVGKSKIELSAPIIIKAENLKSGGINIIWKYDQKLLTKVKEFEVLRSDRYDGTYKSLNRVNKQSTSFIDAKPGRVNYYIIQAIQQDGQSAASFPYLGQIKDSIPPAKPTAPVGEIDKNGVLKLHWKQGKEEDIAGYRVYMANSAEEEYTQITKKPLEDTLFSDTINLNTLTKKVYFKIMAFDLNYNNSPLSNAVEINRPDLIPPVAPVVKDYKVTDSSIYLSWIPSTSNDVIKHVLYRRVQGEVNWTSIVTFENDKLKDFYFDKTAEKVKSYEYAIVAIDNSLLESEKKIIKLALIDRGFRPIVQEISGKADRMNKEIILSWKYVEGTPQKFVIYRDAGTKRKEVKYYQSIPGTERTFKDKDLLINTNYTYKIKAVFSNGAQSPLSKPIEIKY